MGMVACIDQDVSGAGDEDIVAIFKGALDEMDVRGQFHDLCYSSPKASIINLSLAPKMFDNGPEHTLEGVDILTGKALLYGLVAVLD
jgi:hypothetical protein